MQNKIDDNQKVLMLIKHHIFDMSDHSLRDIIFSANKMREPNR